MEIREIAELIVSRLSNLGAHVEVEHWSSQAGHSSYITFYRQIGNQFFNYPIRVSDHSVGPRRYMDYVHVRTVDDAINVCNEITIKYSAWVTGVNK